MNFKTYDILSSIIPGFLVLLALLKLLDIPFNKDLTLPYTVIAFLFGFLMNSISSWLEEFYFWTWGGSPSSNLIEGKRIWKVRFYQHQKVKSLLLNDCENPNPTNDELFAIAMKIANGEKDTRIDDFNSIYAFSRGLLTTVLLSSIFLVSQNFFDWRYYIILFPILAIIWLRCKQRGYYYSKEILNVYLKKKQYG